MCDPIMITDEQLVNHFFGKAVDGLQRRVEQVESQLRGAQLLIVALVQANGGTVHLSTADIVRVKPGIVLERIDDLEGVTLRTKQGVMADV